MKRWVRSSRSYYLSCSRTREDVRLIKLNLGLASLKGKLLTSSLHSEFRAGISWNALLVFSQDLQYLRNLFSQGGSRERRLSAFQDLTLTFPQALPTASSTAPLLRGMREEISRPPEHFSLCRVTICIKDHCLASG